MSHSHEEKDAPFGIGLLLNSTFTILEFAVGTFTGSLALLADATHNLTDTLTLFISYIAQRIGKRSPTRAKTYGYGRATVIAALLNAGILVAVAGFIAFEAFKRLQEPHEPAGEAVAAVAFVGICINGYIAWRFSKRKHDLNARSAYTNMLYDTLSSVGAMVAGIVMVVTGWSAMDSIVGLGIAGMLLFATFKIIGEAIHVLLEGVPIDIDVDAIEKRLRSLQYVKNVDDMHIWGISSDYNALSCHIGIDEKDIARSREVIENAKAILASSFNIQHSTIEIELRDCDENGEHEQAILATIDLKKPSNLN